MMLWNYWDVDHEEIIDGSSNSDSMPTEQDIRDPVECVCTEPDTITPPPDDTTIPTISEDEMATARVTLHAQKTDAILTTAQKTDAILTTAQKPDAILTTIRSTIFFKSEINNTTTNSRFKKVCNVCCQKFSRADDLKRHLIGHIVKSSLAQNPVGSDGTLSILCGICEAATFSRVDTYKAHLSEHAKLTVYKCNFCGKCSNNASNLSKHKKIHGGTCFQCDLCKRKFNSRRNMIEHLALHDATPPLSCEYCGEIFYFKSMLNAHIKRHHVKKVNTKYKCTFCNEYVKSMKEKWDHEWSVHKIRKAVIDCLICGEKFRKYADMKKHFHEKHNSILVIPRKKEFLKNAVQH